MTEEFDFYRDDGSIIYLVEDIENEGEFKFSFDKKKIYNFWTDYPHKLSKEEIEIFKKEYPELAKLKS